MKSYDSIITASFLKSHASEILRDISSNHKTMVITQNGEAKAVLQDVHVYEQTQDSLALLKMLTMGKNKIDEGKYKPVDKSFIDIWKRIELSIRL